MVCVEEHLRAERVEHLRGSGGCVAGVGSGPQKEKGGQLLTGSGLEPSQRQGELAVAGVDAPGGVRGCRRHEWRSGGWTCRQSLVSSLHVCIPSPLPLPPPRLKRMGNSRTPGKGPASSLVQLAAGCVRCSPASASTAARAAAAAQMPGRD
eukprot:113180-Chlamydomonas_euryale.AAC.1